MAGGKETPRQKMIGMMYLVLTALLALNVSKSILDAFVAIEENIQVANENEFMRGEEKFKALQDLTKDDEQKDVKVNALAYLKTVEKINEISAKRIKQIDELKMEILAAIGEDITSVGGAENIVIEPYSSKNPLKPAKLNLSKVNAMDKYDEPMAILVGSEITNPTGKGVELWKSYNDFRTEITELVGNSWIQEPGEKKWFFKAPKINAYKDYLDLNKQIGNAINASNVYDEDKEAIKKIYASLTKKERWTVNDVPNVHWIGKTFDHAPAVAAIASLTSLQKEVLTARADAIAMVRGRVGGGEYSFNKIIALAYGPEIVNQGEDVEVQVLMAAYDSDRQPVVTVANGSVSEVKDGKGIVRMKAGSGNEMVLKGSVTIKNKAGIPKTKEWTKTIRIMKPQGTISLPDLNMLYIGYANNIEAVASGYDETVLSGVGVNVRKVNGKFVADPHKVKQCTISVFGKSNLTGKTVKLGTYTFRVSRLPDPSIYWGAAKDGNKANAQEKNLFAKYDPEVPLKATFQVLSWELIVNGYPGVAPKGNGNQLSPQAISVLRQAKPGTNVTYYIKYMGNDKLTRLKTASFKI
ncbi:MAG: hypothetical protein NWQ47_08170 [Crocinitomicaceae bacterium]|nr:hypothetical protein [Crocinitomicaceae bacterium]